MNRIVTWPVTLREGANDIEVRAANGGEVILDRARWSYRRPPGMIAADGG